mgnify:CR=1 FL=1
MKDTKVMYNFCCQVGHLKNECYVTKNMRKFMKTMWIVRSSTNSYGPNDKKISNVSLLISCVGMFEEHH